MKDSKVICVLSGGMDSTALLYDLKDRGAEIKAISFDYGQKHKKELHYASKNCGKLKVEHTIVDLSAITQLISNSALTGDIDVPEGHYEDESMKQTVVPSRNSIMAIIANAYAINIGYSDIALAVHAGDHAIYPDCREEFLIALQDLFNVNNYEKINVYAPYFDISKADILKRGLELGVDYRNTWSCYNGEEKPCGKCGTCTERTLAFVENNAQDPLYEHPEDWFKAVEYAKEQE